MKSDVVQLLNKLW